MSWTDERIDRLKALWSEGNTASQIADDLGGVSRNAVIGKAHRLGLAARPSPVKASEPKDKLKAELVVEPTPPAEPEMQEEEQAQPAFGPAGVAPADAAGLEEPPASVTAPEPGEAPQPRVVSVGPGGFLRQGPGDQQAPIPPAPPRRLVPAKPSAEVSHKTSLLELNERTCKWPIGHPGEPDFHFCGAKSNPGFPYCVDHCGVAYQAQLPRRDRRPPPPLPFGGPRIR